MRESRTIHLSVTDLIALRSGQPLLIEGADGHPLIRIEWDGAKRRVSTPDPKDGTRAAETAPKKCPYCAKMLRSVKAHIYQTHPGKSLDPTGPKCRYCSKRYASAVSVMRHEVRTHPKVFRGRRTGKLSPKLQAQVNAKEVPHA
jgi:hypothetical protein